MEQIDLFGKPLPPPPPPEPNVWYYGITYTEVEEYFDEFGDEQERVTGKELTTRKFHCEYPEFNSQGYCTGGCESDADNAYCMDITRVETNLRMSDK